MSAQSPTRSFDRCMPLGSIAPVPSGVLQRKCACGQHSQAGQCDECKKNHSVLQRRSAGPGISGAIPPLVHEVLRSPGKALGVSTRAFMESRFNRDFSRVRVHTDEKAGRSARAVGALAYTVGSNVVFAPRQFAPDTHNGKTLLAHELAHTLQQEANERSSFGLRVAESDHHERAADVAAEAVIAGRRPPLASARAVTGLARFSDTGHHVIDEAGLTGAGFSGTEIKAIERGNIQRDYSQVGAVGNFALLCEPKAFGGYKPEEHFDNFIFDAVTNRWRTRGTGQRFLHDDPRVPDRSPVEYIESELMTLADAGMTDASLVYLGNAFHTIEDFFAHSNFVELANKDLSFGTELVTGSFAGESANSAASLAHTLGAVADPKMRPYYDQQAEHATQQTEARSHSRIAKDMPGAHNYEQARRLAALVVQDLGADVRVAMTSPDAKQRGRMMANTVLAKIRRYLQPPGPNDRWWEHLQARDHGTMDRQLNQIAARTPVTVNQCVFSPLRNIEASSSSSWKLPVGVALPVQIGANQVWLQAGVGVTSPLPLDRSVRGDPGRSDEKAGLIGGLQLTGRF